MVLRRFVLGSKRNEKTCYVHWNKFVVTAQGIHLLTYWGALFSKRHTKHLSRNEFRKSGWSIPIYGFDLHNEFVRFPCGVHVNCTSKVYIHYTDTLEMCPCVWYTEAKVWLNETAPNTEVCAYFRLFSPFFFLRPVFFSVPL